MSTATEQEYVLGHTDEEYQRLRAQARVWEEATGRLIDQVELAQRRPLPRRGLRAGGDDATAGPARRACR